MVDDREPIYKAKVPITEGIQHTLMLAAREAREHYGSRPHRRLGYMVKDRHAVAWFGEEVPNG
jgi:hypothetical protein